MNKLARTLTVSLIMIFSYVTMAQNTITMDAYIDQVKHNNPAYKASVESSAGAKLRSKEGDLLTLPQLGLEYSRGVDKSPSTNAQQEAFNGISRVGENYKISLSEQTSFGLNAELSYGQNYRLINGGDPSIVNPSEYYTAAPMIEVSQSLWKNGFGSEVRAQKNALTSQALATYYENRAKNLGVLLEAKGAYYRLYYAQNTLRAVKDSLEVAGKLLKWAKSRMDKGLGEKSDYLQTKANFEARQLDLANAEQEIKSATRFYNSMKGLDSEEISEQLKDPGLPQYKEESFSEAKWRDEVRATQKAAEAAKANSLLGKERNKPTLDVFANYSRNGFDASAAEARSESFKDAFPVYTVGVRFATPIALGKSYDVRNGYEKEAYASDLEFKRKAQEQERDFNDLQSKIKNAFDRLKLAKTLEESQKEKIQEERKRHMRGRTTFFQVLQFEQDYLNSELNRIKTEAELNSLLTQLQQYREE